MVRKKTLHSVGLRSESRRERAQERKGTLTSMVLGRRLNILPRHPHYIGSLKTASRYRPIARDQRGSLLGRCRL